MATGILRDWLYGAPTPEALISAAQALTGSFADVGGEIDVSGFSSLGLWIDLDINDSIDVQFKMLVKLADSATDEYELPLIAATASKANIEPQLIELTNDANQKIMIPFSLDRVIKSVQIQVKAGTLGSPAGILTSAKVTKRWK